MRKLRALLALLGLAVIVAGMPALLIAAAPIGAISITWTPEGILRALATPDNGTLAFALFKAAHHKRGCSGGVIAGGASVPG